MSAGTITLTNGSAVVGGTGTSFTVELAAGDFIVSTVGGAVHTAGEISREQYPADAGQQLYRANAIRRGLVSCSPCGAEHGYCCAGGTKC